MDGPIPISDHDYLIKIYERVGKQNEDIKTLCDGLHDHGKRIFALEQADACQESFTDGREDWWQTYKEPILIIFSLVTGSIITVILYFMGVRS